MVVFIGIFLTLIGVNALLILFSVNRAPKKESPLKSKDIRNMIGDFHPSDIVLSKFKKAV